MPDSPNKLTQFWQELKRRKVIRVIAMYAATAFIIIELVNNVTEPLRLPEWTPTLVILLLAIGFPIAVIISWIFDVTPEGIKKTEPVKAVTEKEAEAKPAKRKLRMSDVMIVVLVIVVCILLYPKIFKQRKVIELEKSIAVLPFHNDSPDEENTYIINGMMEAILDNLCKIEDLRVVSRTSVEQYRNAPKPITEIAEELNVSYILEGSGQKYEDNIRLTVQLLDAINDKHVWSNPYNREIKDIFSIQSEIAQLIATELKAIITPEERQLIEKTPTPSLTAYDFYQRGRDEYIKYWLDSDNREALESAEDFYHRALEYDSTFAQAYTGLAWVYWDKHYWETYFSEDFVDSVLILVNIALSFDDQQAEAYTIKGNYYSEIGKSEEALKEYGKALKFNPNDWMAYYGKGLLNLGGNSVKWIDNLQKAASLNHGPELPGLLRSISQAYLHSGFIEKSKYYNQEALKLDGDSAKYYSSLTASEFYLGNHEKALELVKKGYAIDSNNTDILLSLGEICISLGQYKEGLKYIKKGFERLKILGISLNRGMHRIGYAYWINGFKEEAEYYFNEQINYCNRMNELGRIWAQQLYPYYDLAGIYAFRGEKDKAYKNLRIFNQRQRMALGIVYYFNNDPLFDSIRDEEEFQQIVRDVEAKYQAERERVRKWLEENDLPG